MFAQPLAIRHPFVHLKLRLYAQHEPRQTAADGPWKLEDLEASLGRSSPKDASWVIGDQGCRYIFLTVFLHFPSEASWLKLSTAVLLSGPFVALPKHLRRLLPHLMQQSCPSISG